MDQDSATYAHANAIASTSDQPSYMDSSQDHILGEVVQYAYENDLTRDHRLSSFSISHLFGALLKSTIAPTVDHGFTDCSQLADLEVPSVSPRENVIVTDSAFRLICEARRMPKEDEIQSLSNRVCTSGNLRDLKLELPILRTDNDWDMREFEIENAARMAIDFQNHRLPLDPPNVENGEGLELSVKTRHECKAMTKKLEDQGRLEMTKTSMTYLVDQLKVECSINDTMQYLVDDIKYEKGSRMEKLTPPISPILGPKHFVPAAEDCLVPIPSGSHSTLNDELKHLEDSIFEKYGDVWTETTPQLQEYLENDVSISDVEALLSQPRESLEDLKVDVPLMTDPMPSRPGPSEPNQFNDFVHVEMDLDPEFEKAVLENLSDDNLDEELQDAAAATMKSIEQEQLQAFDAIARVPIPVVDFSVPEPEWTRLRNSEKSIFKWIHNGNEQLFSLPSWPVHKLAESKLLWKPIGSGAKPALETETVDYGVPLIETFVQRPRQDEAYTSLDLVQKRDKLAVLGHKEEDEEIEAQFARRNDQTSLMDIVRKRLLDNHNDGPSKKPRPAAVKPSLERSDDAEDEGRRSLLPGNSPGTSAKLLANFMDLHAPKKKWTRSEYFGSSKAQPTAPSVSEETSKKSRATDEGQRIAENYNHALPVPVPPAPSPPINPPCTQITVFITTKISPRMIRSLEALLPELTVFDRNYDEHNTFEWRQGSVRRTEIIPPLAFDADVTISPTTGLIITSMIKIRQKPLQGTNKSTVQARIEKTSLRYDKLIILVGNEGSNDQTLSGISSSDSLALAELQGFASGLSCTALVHYVGGGDNTMAKWVGSYVCRYSQTDPAVQDGLLELETHWEVFLRRVGFNVFAAQAIANQLKTSRSEIEGAQPSQYGLIAFATMTRAERMRRFEQLVGSRVLERVSMVVDQLWNKG